LEAQRLAAKEGYRITNIDSTVILEQPKLKDFRLPIRRNLASFLRLDLEAISLKFKTAEKVGPVGEGRSCEAQAVVLLALA
jgi:2-C-methyl-D-erythritol 2,4-cyclodiphosphate synthase